MAGEQMIDPIKTAYIAGYMGHAEWDGDDERVMLENEAAEMYDFHYNMNWYKLGEAVDKVAAHEREAEKYRFLLDMFRHYKWSDVDAIYELRPEGEKWITVESLDAALTSVVTYTRENA